MGGLGSGGHNRKSAAQHKLQGTYRKDRHTEGGIMQVGPPDLTPPETLGEDGRDFIASVSPALTEAGLLDALSARPFMLMATVYDEAMKLRQYIATDGRLLTGPRGKEYPHPLLSHYRQMIALFLDFAQDFGMTPASRRRLGSFFDTTPPKDDKESPWAFFTNRTPN
jgi:P27 family predicted phage terminase small subunit